MTDLPLSLLYQWQQLLEVPVADLLVDGGDAFAADQAAGHARCA